MIHQHRGKSSKSFIDAKAVLSGQLIKNQTFLDVGCADGHFCITASKLVGKGKVIGLDADVISLGELKSLNIKNITTLNEDFTKKTSIESESIDVVLMSNVLHGFVHNGELDSVVHELKRVMSSKGKLLVVEFKEDSPIGPPSNIKLTPVQLDDILKPHGFVLENTFDAGAYSYCSVFRLE